jgi:hypothetical protein
MTGINDKAVDMRSPPASPSISMSSKSAKQLELNKKLEEINQGCERFELMATHVQQEGQMQSDIVRAQFREENAQRQAKLDERQRHVEEQGGQLRLREAELYQRQQKVVSAKLSTADVLLQRAGAAAFDADGADAGNSSPDLQASIQLYTEAVSYLAATLERLQPPNSARGGARRDGVNPANG